MAEETKKEPAKLSESIAKDFDLAKDHQPTTYLHKGRALDVRTATSEEAQAFIDATKFKGLVPKLKTAVKPSSSNI